jgi:serine/threonine protein kinase
VSSTGSGGWDFGSGQGYQPSQGPADRLGLSRIGPYEIEGEVARGGMGVVYRGRDVRLGRPVAIKLLLAPGATGPDTPRVRRFSREAEALASLGHPGLLGVYDFGILPHPAVPYMITEWLEGQTLDQRLRQEGTMDVAEALDLAEAIARAVAHAHGRGVLHRDLKPSNVVLAPRGPVVIDFGLAKRQDLSQSRLTQTGAMAGTAGFAAPEQIRDASDVDERADVYGLGATLYAILTGFPPGGHEGQNLQVLAANATGKFPLPSELRPEVPRAVDRLVARALALAPEDRLADAGEFADAVADLPSFDRRPALKRFLGLGLAVVALIGFGLLLGKTILVLRDKRPSGTGPSELNPSPSSPSPGTQDPPPLASPTRPPPSPLPPGRVGELLGQLARLEGELLEAPVEVEALAGLYGRGEALAEEILAAAKTSRELWPVAQFYVTAGRVELANPLLRALAKDPSFSSRANLELAWLALTKQSTEGLRPALRRASARELTSALDPDEALAARLAKVLHRVQSLGFNRSAASSVRIELAALLREGHESPWRIRSVWSACVFAAFMAPPDYRQLISEAWSPSRNSLAKLQLPKFATISAWHLGLANGREPTVVEELGDFFEAHAGRIPSSEFQLALANGYASAGSRGALERALARQSGLPSAARERLERQAGLMAEARGGVSAGEIRAASFRDPKRPVVEWLRVRCDPTQRLLGVWLVLPPEAQRWGVRLAGAEVDFDLRLRRDGPPSKSTGWSQTSLTMARNERLEARGGGLYFLQIERATPWPAALELALELHTPGPGAKLSLSRDPWEFKMSRIEIPGLREAFSNSRIAFKAGQIDQALSALDPFLDRSPQAKYVRWSLLDLAARWENLASDAKASMQDAGPRGQLAAWLFARCLAATNQVPHAQRTFTDLTRRAPEVLEAWTALIGVETGIRGAKGGQEVLAQAQARFPNAPVLDLLDLILKGRALNDAFAIRFRELQGHSEARRQALSLLFFAGRAPDALPLLEALPADLRDLPRSLIYRAYALLSVGRPGEARKLLESVDAATLSPQLQGQFQRALRSLEGR